LEQFFVPNFQTGTHMVLTLPTQLVAIVTHNTIIIAALKIVPVVM
jgi:hypothetical protein